MKNKYIVYGASGHGKVIADIIEKMGASILGFVDDDENLWGKKFYNYKVLGGYDYIFNNRENLILIGIGNNQTRKTISEKISKTINNFGTAIHPSAYIGRGSVIEEGTVVMAKAVVNSDTKIGKHCIINTSATVDHDCYVEDYVHISPGSNIGGGVKIGELSWIGIGSSIKHMINIGKNCIVGAGAVVVDDIPDNSVFIGNPAKFLKNN